MESAKPIGAPNAIVSIFEDVSKLENRDQMSAPATHWMNITNPIRNESQRFEPLASAKPMTKLTQINIS